jgi:hypothetical protein
MGYHTTFEGRFDVEPALTPEDQAFLLKLSNTRRMARNVGPEYGVEGEFYVDGEAAGDEDVDDPTVIDDDCPPRTQPSLWCHWAPAVGGTTIRWNGREKFYEYVAWIEYLVDTILQPRGYTLNGTVRFQGEDPDDTGVIELEDNLVRAWRFE